MEVRDLLFEFGISLPELNDSIIWDVTDFLVASPEEGIRSADSYYLHRGCLMTEQCFRLSRFAVEVYHDSKV